MQLILEVIIAVLFVFLYYRMISRVCDCLLLHFSKIRFGFILALTHRDGNNECPQPRLVSYGVNLY